jgi:hypothetical protein
LDLQVPADGFRSLAHADQAQVTGSGQTQPIFRQRKAHPIIPDGQAYDPSTLLLQVNVDLARLGMMDYIGQRLLENTE